MNWTAANKRPAWVDRVRSRGARAHEPSAEPRADEQAPSLASERQPDPATDPRRASSVRAFTPRDAYVPRHRADVPTDWVRQEASDGCGEAAASA